MTGDSGRTLALTKSESNFTPMNDTELLTAALKLPTRKREKVAEVLLESIKLPSKRHLDRLWAQESESRIDAFLAGKIRAVSGERVLKYRTRK